MAGLSVAGQLDPNVYFSLYTITASRMKAAGLNLSIKQLRELARNSKEYKTIYTGDEKDVFRQKEIKIYRYEDFKQYSYKDCGV